MTPMSERRGGDRFVACYPADLEQPSGDTALALIRDISVTGAMLFVADPLDAGTNLKLALYIADDPKVSYPAEARVIRSQRRTGGDVLWRYSVAVEFVHPLEDRRADVERLARTLPPIPVGDV